MDIVENCVVSYLSLSALQKDQNKADKDCGLAFYFYMSQIYMYLLNQQPLSTDCQFKKANMYMWPLAYVASVGICAILMYGWYKVQGITKM